MDYQVKTKDSQIHTHSMLNRKLDFGYMRVDWGDGTPIKEHVWTMPGSGIPTDRLPAMASLVLGLIFFMLIPMYLASWMPFYWAKRAEGLETGQIIEITIWMWWSAFMVYVNHYYDRYDKWSRTEEGKACIDTMCPCYKRKE